MGSGFLPKNYLLIKSSGSNYIPSTLNFFEYSPFSPRNVGIPLSAETPAPVTNKISLQLIIAYTAFFMSMHVGFYLSSFYEDLLV
jgi:hypothetical protein